MEEWPSALPLTPFSIFISIRHKILAGSTDDIQYIVKIFASMIRVIDAVVVALGSMFALSLLLGLYKLLEGKKKQNVAIEDLGRTVIRLAFMPILPYFVVAGWLAYY